MDEKIRMAKWYEVNRKNDPAWREKNKAAAKLWRIRNRDHDIAYKRAYRLKFKLLRELNGYNSR